MHNTSRSTSGATSVGAFFLGALLGLLFSASARAADPLRLDRIAIEQFSPAPDSQLLQRHGVLSVDGRIAWRASATIPRPAVVSDDSLNRPLIRVDAWLAYYRLGYGALAAFTVLDGAVQFRIGADRYYSVAPSTDVLLADGPVLNLSTRTVLTPAGPPVIAGFVISDRARTVLIRAIGPGLRPFGVTTPAADPTFTVKLRGETVFANNDWGSASNAADLLRAAEHVGAFPLTTGSRDAAGLVLLAPGAYTVQVESAHPTHPAGDVLVEIYSVPDGFFLTGESRQP